jgi:hypothetical protein
MSDTILVPFQPDVLTSAQDRRCVQGETWWALGELAAGTDISRTSRVRPSGGAPRATTPCISNGSHVDPRQSGSLGGAGMP